VRKITMQEVVFPIGIVLPAAFDAVFPLYLNAEETRGVHIEDRRRVRVFDGGVASFDAYFNRLHAGYWARFGQAETAYLELRTSGRGHLSVLRSTPDGKTLHVHSQDIDATGHTDVELDIRSASAGGTLWFELRAAGGDLVVHEARWSAGVPAHHREVVVDVAICTYNRAEDVVGCLQGLVASEGLRSHLGRVRVIDNGTESFLDAPGGAEVAAVWGDQLETVYQQNLGGSGGFSRGMAEALKAGTATHVLLLDDDVVVEPEGLRRAIALASITPSPTIVGAHMLERLRPTTLWTTGEVLDPIDFSIMAANEIDGYRIDLEEERQESVVPAAFNGWWSCLIPIETIETVGLSLPFFIKWDDIEFGYRAGEAGYPTITLPGAAVWHESWDTKDDVDNWTLYFTVRNRLIHAAMESAKLPVAIRKRRARAVLASIWRNDILVFLSRRMFANAEAVVRAVADFASGVDILDEPLPAQAKRVREARKGYPDVPVRFPSDRLEALDIDDGDGSILQLGTAPIRIAQELIAGEPSDEWKLRRDLPTALNIAGDSEVGLEVLPKANDRWGSILRRADVYVSTIDGKFMSRRRRDSARSRSLLARSARTWSAAYRAFPDLSEQWGRKRAELASPAHWDVIFKDAAVDEYSTGAS
jgi:galactofuranosylgalactofuranosylrhamnosyl-N-acetylglucosaminyl-diphospho-decaprenol beta-1,5/1,6-galactofuranosyltransferase